MTEQHPGVVAGDIHDGEAVYAVKLHKAGEEQLNESVRLLSAQVRAESGALITWMTIQFVVIVALLLIILL